MLSWARVFETHFCALGSMAYRWRIVLGNGGINFVVDLAVLFFLLQQFSRLLIGIDHDDIPSKVNTLF